MMKKIDAPTTWADTAPYITPFQRDYAQHLVHVTLTGTISRARVACEMLKEYAPLVRPSMRLLANAVPHEPSERMRQTLIEAIVAAGGEETVGVLQDLSQNKRLTPFDRRQVREGIEALGGRPRSWFGKVFSRDG